jgi:hypothetical protein
MKKLVLSAFAMSLWTVSGIGFSQTNDVDEFLGLKEEGTNIVVLPELQGQQKFTPRNFHQTESWNVHEQQVELDKEPLKGQTYSLVPWSTQDPEAWLDIDQWLIERATKDQIPDWKIRLRDDTQLEHVGKILHCHGHCELYRGTKKVLARHLSGVTEGDELRTDKDSTAWVFLMDGSLARLGSESSISFQEISWTKTQVFHLVRLNQGQVFWHPRAKAELPLDLSPETDAISLPLMIREANQEQFERQRFQKQTDGQRMGEHLNLDEDAIKDQVQRINELRKAHETLETKVMMVSSNATISSTNIGFDFVHIPGGKSYVKKRPAVANDFTLHLRGYTLTDAVSLDEAQWVEIEPNGRAYHKLTSPPGYLQIVELMTSRIKSLELARELWIEKYSLPILKNLGDPKKVAVEFGYHVWGEDLHRRIEFLTEYTRRIETTNLKSMENLLKKREDHGDTIKRELSDEIYRISLTHYLLGLKKRYHVKRMQVREMNDLQYYVWILRNGKY